MRAQVFQVHYSPLHSISFGGVGVWSQAQESISGRTLMRLIPIGIAATRLVKRLVEVSIASTTELCRRGKAAWRFRQTLLTQFSDDVVPIFSALCVARVGSGLGLHRIPAMTHPSESGIKAVWLPAATRAVT